MRPGPALSAATARTVAAELTVQGALAAHLDAELHIDPMTSPARSRPPQPAGTAPHPHHPDGGDPRC
jgi:hypothetical protein